MEARRMVEEAAGGRGPGCLDEPVSTRALPYFEALVERRATDEPLQYVLGRWGFRRLDLLVDRRVMIPRPETEQVVEVALEELCRLSSLRNGIDPVIVDLGTGSGAIALSLALEWGKGAVWATDRSPDALAVAKANLAGLGGEPATRVRVVEGWWWSALPVALRGRVSLAVSNPPYVTTAEMARLPVVVADWEPPLALEGGEDGLDPTREIIGRALDWLSRPGTLVVEIAPGQAAAAASLADAAGFTAVEVRPDLAGRERVLVARA
jgi:release factor glutamine methyltransferase